MGHGDDPWLWLLLMAESATFVGKLLHFWL